MSNDTICFECLRLQNSNKKGILTPDENGCYTMVVGALDAHSFNGGFYEYNAASKFFTDDSSFQRKIQRGVIRGEYGHPKKYPGMTDNEYIARLMRIDEKETCCEFTKIWLEKGILEDDKKRPVVAIFAKVRPMGPYGSVLKEQFETPGMQCCFSIRCFTENTFQRGMMVKKIEKIITFDYVNEPGMHNAEKLLSPTLETLDDYEFSLSSIQENAKQNNNIVYKNDSYELTLEDFNNAFSTHYKEEKPLRLKEWL